MKNERDANQALQDAAAKKQQATWMQPSKDKKAQKELTWWQKVLKG